MHLNQNMSLTGNTFYLIFKAYSFWGSGVRDGVYLGVRGQLLKVGSLVQPIESRDQTQVIGLVWQVPLCMLGQITSLFLNYFLIRLGRGRSLNKRKRILFFITHGHSHMCILSTYHIAGSARGIEFWATCWIKPMPTLSHHGDHFIYLECYRKYPLETSNVHYSDKYYLIIINNLHLNLIACDFYIFVVVWRYISYMNILRIYQIRLSFPPL